jgi:hypothetical protein
MAICYSCNKLVYLGIEHLSVLSVGERCVYNGLEDKIITAERFRDITLMENIGVYTSIGQQLVNKFCYTKFQRIYGNKTADPVG